MVRREWLQHLDRMDDGRLPKDAFRYRPFGTRDVGRPRVKWRDTLWGAKKKAKCLLREVQKKKKIKKKRECVYVYIFLRKLKKNRWNLCGHISPIIEEADSFIKCDCGAAPRAVQKLHGERRLSNQRRTAGCRMQKPWGR